MSTLFRHPGGALPNSLAIGYTLLGWPLGIWLMTRPDIAQNGLGVLLTAHTLVFSAYLIHDCAHHAIFSTARANDRLGTLLSWINGSCLANYARLKEKHLRHHADRMDVVTFDYRARLRQSPAWLRRLVLALEWAYVPAVELLMRLMVILMPFSAGGSDAARRRMLALLSLRLLALALLAAMSLKALLLYGVAFLLFLHVLRFLDAFQHTYELYVSRDLAAAPVDPRRDRRYEYENTYSDLIAVRWPWLNLLALNFAYHNAHHVRPVEPWYRLPALHQSLYGDHDPQVIPCRALLASYHQHRLARVLSSDCGGVATTGDRAAGFIGAVGVSFLTAV
jgi:fatty acid desaturase